MRISKAEHFVSIDTTNNKNFTGSFNCFVADPGIHVRWRQRDGENMFALECKQIIGPSFL